MINKLKLVLLCCWALPAAAQSLGSALDLQAHRGGRGLMPENTIPAMLHAIALGAKTLELDCVISADGKVVVSHDVYMSSDFMLKPDGSEISKAEEKQYLLYRMTYDSIRSFPEGVKTHPKFTGQQKVKTYKPLLSDLIDSVELYVRARHLKPVYYNMEVKSTPDGDEIAHPGVEKFVALMMGVIGEKGVAGRVTVQSFDPRALRVVHREYPLQTTSLLVENHDGFEKNISGLGYTPAVYSPDFKLVDTTLVRQAHAAGVQVLPWTVNEVSDMRILVGLGVDGLISDYPDRLVATFGRYQ